MTWSYKYRVFVIKTLFSSIFGLVFQYINFITHFVYQYATIFLDCNLDVKKLLKLKKNGVFKVNSLFGVFWALFAATFRMIAPPCYILRRRYQTLITFVIQGIGHLSRELDIYKEFRQTLTACVG